MLRLLSRRLMNPTILLIACLALGAQDAMGADDASAKARQIIEAAGVSGGLVVHLGCGDGRLTAALHAPKSYLVHGLDTDPGNVRRALEHIQSLKLGGEVSVARFDGRHLPYADNLVNLLVAENLGGVTTDEAMRVLAPGGVLYAKMGERWTKQVKPRPAAVDEWTHYLHDASGNAVAHDTVVGPPRRLQWVADPRHARSHEHLPTIFAVVSAGGRIFYIADEGPTAWLLKPPKWRVVARDAFNGVLLWERPVESWYPYIVNWGTTPPQLQRRLVAAGDRVYVTLGVHAPLSALDAATGETVRVYQGTEGTDEVVFHKGVLLLVVRAVTPQRRAQLTRWTQLERQPNSPLYNRDTALPLVKELRSTEWQAPVSLVALDPDTGRTLWRKTGDDARGVRPLSLCALGDRVFYQRAGKVFACELATGREIWSQNCGTLRTASGDVLVCNSGSNITAVAAATGKTRWTSQDPIKSIRDVFVIGDSVWIGGFKPCPGKRSGAWGPYFATQHDLATGKILKHIEPANPGHHHRCWRNKATDKYIIGGRRGAEFIDLKTGEVLWHSWVRGVCRYGTMPANGLLYAPPHACGCYIAAKLTGFNALAPASAAAGPAAGAPARAGEVLEKGPAFSQIANRKSQIANAPEWPTYRHDPARSGHTPSPVAPALRVAWRAEVGGRLTAPVVAEGKVFAASVDRHVVCAFDAASGLLAWKFIAGGRIDSPPTIYRGRALFGCRDGWVYCLRASDGALAWRLRAAPAERLVVARGQLESAWPVHGSVLVERGVAYLTAGRSSYLDGGIDLLRVEPETGRVLSRNTIYSPDPKTGRQPPHMGPCEMPGALADILSSDGEHVYLRDAVFDGKGRPQRGRLPHLFTLTGFLDDTWPHRSYWIYGKRCSLSTGCSGRDRKLLYGRLLATDGKVVYGYGRKSVHWSNQLQDGPTRLFARAPGETKERWAKRLPIVVRAMIAAGNTILAAGPSETAWRAPKDTSGEEGATLMAIATADGAELSRVQMPAAPVLDGIAAAGGRVFVSLENGQLLCLGGKGQ